MGGINMTSAPRSSGPSEPRPFGVLDASEVAPVGRSEILGREASRFEVDAVGEGPDPRVL